MKYLLRFILICVAVIIAAFYIFRTPDTDRDIMVQKYTNDASRFVSDGQGGKIHYRDEGNKDGPAILFIHGSNSHLQTWEGLVTRLSGKYRLISVDLYGHGLTGPNVSGNYSADANIALATTVLDKLNVRQAYWAGSSMGGRVSWHAGLNVPDRVTGLILIDSAGAQTGEKIKPYLGARLAQSQIGQWLLPEITPKFLVRSSLEENYAQPERLTDDIVTRYWEMLRFPGSRTATIDRSKVDREPEKWSEIGDLNMPVLILWGEQDSVIPPSHARAFKDALPKAQLKTYADAGHLPMEETPGQVARDIEIWIGQIETQKKASTMAPRQLSLAQVSSGQ